MTVRCKLFASNQAAESNSNSIVCSFPASHFYSSTIIDYTISFMLGVGAGTKFILCLKDSQLSLDLLLLANRFEHHMGG